MKYGLTILLIFTLYINNLHASVEKIFNEANTAYKKGNYEKAIELYQKIINSGIKNGYVYYNLGNAYYKKGEIGKAILYYEKAKKYISGDDDLEFNLKFLNSIKQDKIKEPEYNPFVKVLIWFYNLFSVNTLFFLSYIFLILLIIYFIVKWFTKNILLKEWFRRILPAIIILFILFSTLFTIKWYHNENNLYGIIIEKETEVKSGPGANYTVIFTLHEGTKVKILREVKKWYFITLPNGYSGWVEAKVVGII